MAPSIAPSWTSGEMLELHAVGLLEEGAATVSFRALIECRGGGKFAFALPGHPYRRLRLAPSGQPEWDPGPSAGSRICGVRESSWSVDGDGARVSISIGSKRGGVLYLAPAPQLAVVIGEEDSVDCCLSVSPNVVHWLASVAQEVAAPSAPLSVASACGSLCEAQLRRFVEDGYVVAAGAVPPDVWATAKAFVNGKLGRLAVAGAAGTAVAPADAEEEEVEAADPAGEEHVRHPLHKVWGSSSWQLLGLCRCAPVARMLEQLIGRGCVDPHFGAQVALRFPGLCDDLVAGGAAVRTRVTGRDWHTDGLRQGKKHPFSVLVGVALSDMDGPDQGNLCVWPGSHYWAQVHSRWPDGHFQRERGWERTDGPLPDLGCPLQLRLKAGDVLLAHSELAHCGGPLLGPEIRHMVYFRVKHRAWRRMREGAAFVEDMWCDLEGLSEALGSGFATTPAAAAQGEAVV